MSFILGTIAVILGILFNSFALSTYWDWFIVPQFDVKPLPMYAAYAVIVFVSYFTYKSDAIQNAKPFIDRLAEYFGRAAGLLLVGWIIHSIFA